MKRPRTPPRMLHHMSVVDRLLHQGQALDRASVGGRRQRQRRLWLTAVLADAPEVGAQREERFWVVLRWGGCGLLAAETLHHLLPR